MPVEHIAKFLQTNPRTIRKLLQELEKNSVFSRDSNGAIYSRRMVRDAKKSKQGQEFAERRWKKPPNGSGNGSGSGPPNGSPNGSGNGGPNARIISGKGISPNGIYPFPEARARGLSADAPPAAPPSQEPPIDPDAAAAVLGVLVTDLTGRPRYEIQEPKLTPEEQIALLQKAAP